MIKYFCSDGRRVSQATIDRNYGKTIRGLSIDSPRFYCSCRGKNCTILAQDWSHIISRKRLKELHKTELIWDSQSFEPVCRTCHREHEEYKSGLWIYHNGLVERLQYIYNTDREHYMKRIDFDLYNTEQCRILLKAIKEVNHHEI